MKLAPAITRAALTCTLIVAPAATGTAVNAALAAPDVAEKLKAAGIEPAGGTPQAFGAFIQSEMTKWAKVAADADIKPE